MMATRWWRKLLRETLQVGSDGMGHGWDTRGPDDLSGKIVELLIHPGIAVFFCIPIHDLPVTYSCA